MSTRSELQDQALQHGWTRETTFGDKEWFLELEKTTGGDRKVRLRVEFAESGRVDFAIAFVRGVGEQRITGGRSAVLRYIKAAK